MKIGKLIIDNYKDKYDSKKFIKVYENMVVANGGDGTLLKAFYKYAHLQKPFWGVNGGSLGFMMNKSLPKKLKKAKFKKFYGIDVTVVTKGAVFNSQSYNDVMIGGDMNTFAHFDITEKDNFFGKISGGGLIISTQLGSTGINKSNNGSVLPFSSTLWSVTGDKTERKIDYVIKPRKMVIDVKARTPITVWIDGSQQIIEDVTQIILRKGKQPVEVVFGDYAEFKKKRRI